MGTVPKPMDNMNIPMLSLPNDEDVHNDLSPLTPVFSFPSDIISDVFSHSNIPSNTGNNPILSSLLQV